MLFNSYTYLFLFLPVTIIVYFLLNRFRQHTLSKAWLTLASLFFYSYWNIIYLPLILGSIFFNYLIGRLLSTPRPRRKMILAIGIIGNVLLLGYYKYTDFFISNLNFVTHADLPLLQIVLPLGISFFTFTQIAYLVDCYRDQVKERNLLSYMLFVTFFPHLLAGPILHHKEMMPQFDDPEKKPANSRNLAAGLYLLAMGLFKKVVVADTFANWANSGYDHHLPLTFVQAWATSISYLFQLYFDFSGYTDMAIASALMLNIKLPINFNSPLKAVSIQDFWRRWHMTLSRFLRDYIYIPLGGNRKGPGRTYVNLMMVFIVGGIWHGAGWLFIIWGLLHGVGSAVHRFWNLRGFKMNKLLAWFITFLFVDLTFIPFRARSLDDMMRVVKGMFGLNGFETKSNLLDRLTMLNADPNSTIETLVVALLLVVFFFVAIFARNTQERLETFQPRARYGWLTAAMLVLALIYMQKVSSFLYFNF